MLVRALWQIKPLKKERKKILSYVYGQYCIYIGQSDIDIEQQKLLYTIGRSINCYNHFGENFGNTLVGCTMRKAYNSAIIPLSMCSRETLTYILYNIYIKRHVNYILTPVFTITKIIQMSIQSLDCVIIIQWNTI